MRTWNRRSSTSWIMCAPAGRFPRCARESSPTAYFPSRHSICGARRQKMENWPRRTPPWWRWCGVCRTTGAIESRTAPRMGNHTDPDIDFAEVFAMDGLSTSYAIRNIFGLFYTQELFEFLRTPPTDAWNRVQRAQAIQALAFIAGLRGVTPRAMLTLCDPVRSGLSLPLVQSSSSADFTFNYIDQLLKAPNLDALLQHASIPAPFSLLYLLLRHSMMVEYANAAARALGRAPHLRAEPEHVRFTPAADGNAARSHYGGRHCTPDRRSRNRPTGTCRISARVSRR